MRRRLIRRALAVRPPARARGDRHRRRRRRLLDRRPDDRRPRRRQPARDRARATPTCSATSSARARPRTGRGALLTFGQLTDFQLVDEESPARVEFLDKVGPPFTAAYRPQEGTGPQVADAMVRQMANASARSRSRRIDAVMTTGDNTDNTQCNETRWMIDILDGAANADPGSCLPRGLRPSTRRDRARLRRRGHLRQRARRQPLRRRPRRARVLRARRERRPGRAGLLAAPGPRTRRRPSARARSATSPACSSA